jgi:hypothetical protein
MIRNKAFDFFLDHVSKEKLVGKLHQWVKEFVGQFFIPNVIKKKTYQLHFLR